MCLESILAKLAEKMTGKAPTAKTVEGILQFIVDNYTAPSVEGIHGIPTGGTAGQVLAKVDGTDYNVQWADDKTGAPG